MKGTAFSEAIGMLREADGPLMRELAADDPIMARNFQRVCGLAAAELIAAELAEMTVPPPRQYERNGAR